MKKINSIFFLSLLLLASINSAYAQDGVDISGLSFPGMKIQTDWTIGDLLMGGPNRTGFRVIDFIFFLAGLIFFFNLLYAAWDYVLSTGDPKKIQGATSRLINAFLGFVIVLGSFVIIRIALAIIGIPDVLKIV